MKNLSLYFGLTLFMVFLLTGQYMQHIFKPLHLDKLVMRMQVRANHIYILFISLLNIMAFRCNLTGQSRITRYLDKTFRLVLIASGILMVVAFFIENQGDMANRNFTKYSALLSIVGIGLVLANEFVVARVKNRQSS